MLGNFGFGLLHSSQSFRGQREPSTIVQASNQWVSDAPRKAIDNAAGQPCHSQAQDEVGYAESLADEPFIITASHHPGRFIAQPFGSFTGRRCRPQRESCL